MSLKKLAEMFSPGKETSTAKCVVILPVNSVQRNTRQSDACLGDKITSTVSRLIQYAIFHQRRGRTARYPKRASALSTNVMREIRGDASRVKVSFPLRTGHRSI